MSQKEERGREAKGRPSGREVRMKMRCGRHRHQKHKAPPSCPEEKVIDARIPVVLPLETLVWEGKASLLLDAHPPYVSAAWADEEAKFQKRAHP